MKTYRWIFATLLLTTLAFGTQGFAEETKSTMDVQTIRDAAKELKSTNAEMSTKLEAYADKEAAAAKDAKAELKQEDMQLLLDSAAAVEKTNPELAAKLRAYSNDKSKEANK